MSFAAAAVLRSGGKEMDGVIANLSEGGCFIQAASVLPKGSHLQLSFAVSALIFRCQAVVRHGSGYGMGLQFMAMDRATRAGLRSLVKSQA